MNHRVDEGALRDRTALVTGGGRGIGRAIALAFADQGASVAIAARTLEEVQSVAEECRAFGAESLALQLDVTDARSCERAVESCREDWGRIDILVNNAGIVRAQRFVTIDDAGWERTIAVDLTGAFYMTRAALPGLLERGDGRVIAISSIAGKVGAPYLAAYTAAKHGLIGMMRALALEYARSGVTFNSVCPSYVDTPMTERAIEEIIARSGRTREQVLKTMMTPQGRLVTPEEVAAVCVLLASAAGRSINGQAINVDGGWVQS